MAKVNLAMARNRRSRSKRPDHPLTVMRPELLVGGDDAAFRRFVHNFLAFSGRIHTIRHSFGKLVGLSGVRYSVLISIFHLEGEDGVSVGDVAEHLHLGLATLTVETNKLAQLGLVVKRQDSRDRRRVLLRLTGRGKRLLEQLAPVQRQVNDELFRALSKADFERLASVFTHLVPCSDRAVSCVRHLAAAKKRGKRKGNKQRKIGGEK